MIGTRSAVLYVTYGVIGLGLAAGLIGASLIRRAWNALSIIERVPV